LPTTNTADDEKKKAEALSGLLGKFGKKNVKENPDLKDPQKEENA